MNTCDKPMAAHGLNSYRYRSRYGWVMIGARDDQEALREAQRSVSSDKVSLENLQAWDGNEYRVIS